jgi:rubrerythrin
MPTLLVTKDTGGKTKPMPMTVAAPERQMTPDALERLAPGGGLDGRALADLLSAFCAHERAGAHLYRCLAEKTKKQAWKRKYREFGAETEDHIGIYEELIRRLGGDPQYVSPQARLTAFQGAKLMEAPLLAGSLDLETEELAGLEAVVLAETKCHANWQLLAALGRQLAGSKAKEAILEAVARVEPQEDEHLGWAKSAWEKALLGQLGRAS